VVVFLDPCSSNAHNSLDCGLAASTRDDGKTMQVQMKGGLHGSTVHATNVCVCVGAAADASNGTTTTTKIELGNAHLTRRSSEVVLVWLVGGVEGRICVGELRPALDLPANSAVSATSAFRRRRLKSHALVGWRRGSVKGQNERNAAQKSLNSTLVCVRIVSPSN
jgi:hypothetical protein